MIELPDLRQTNSWSCGPVAAAVVLRHFNRPIPRQWPSSSAIDGTHPSALVPVFNRAGLRVLSGSCSRELLAAHVRTGSPAVCLVQMGKESHYVVCQGWERNRVWFHCPIRGPKQRQRIDDFLAGWWADGDDKPRQFHQFAALVWEG